MGKDTENLIMKTTFCVMCRILRHIEKSLDDAAFDRTGFTAERFGISENRFARILALLVRDGYVTGIEVEDYGEPERDDPFSDGEEYRRFGIKIGNPSITVAGIRFQAENTFLMRGFNMVKDISGILKP